MTERKWSVSSPSRLRVMPRGNSGDYVAVEFETSPPLPDGLAEQVRQELREILAKVLPKDATVARFLALRDNLTQAERGAEGAKLAVEGAENERKRLLLKAVTPEAAERLRALDSERASAGHSHASLMGLKNELTKQLEQARAAVEQRLRSDLQRAASAAIERYSAAVPALAAAVSEAAGSALDKLVEGLKCLRYV